MIDIKDENGTVLAHIGHFPYEKEYHCKCCGSSIYDSCFVYRNENDTYCECCSFKKGFISEREYLDICGIFIDTARAGIHNGEIEVIFDGKFEWEKTDADLRKSKQYKIWRTKVFERDRYTCQKCGQYGGRLNAHHIEHFSKNKQKRFCLENGITLCEKCHRKVHKNER